jgi:predicted transcriptional regulator
MAAGESIVAAAEPQTRVPAVAVRKSITPEHLICLDDGLKFKSLKRHLAKLGMTPEQYRAKWDLPGAYPMVAPKYAAVRSALAKKIGLGQMRGVRVAKNDAPVRSKSQRGRPRKVAA